MRHNLLSTYKQETQQTTLLLLCIYTHTHTQNRAAYSYANATGTATWKTHMIAASCSSQIWRSDPRVASQFINSKSKSAQICSRVGFRYLASDPRGARTLVPGTQWVVFSVNPQTNNRINGTAISCCRLLLNYVLSHSFIGLGAT